MVRVDLLYAGSDARLDHRYDDGPEPTGLLLHRRRLSCAGRKLRIRGEAVLAGSV